MICPSCKAENIEGADACVNCGNALYGLDLPGGGKRDTVPEFVQHSLSRLPARGLTTAGRSDPVALAVRRMQTENASAVLVMEGDRPAGIITAWDVLHKVAGSRSDLNAVTCEQIMTASPVTLGEEDTLALALYHMAHGSFRHMPVTVQGKPATIVDVNDLFRHISPYLV